MNTSFLRVLKDWNEKRPSLENTQKKLLKSWQTSWNNEMRTWSCRNLESFDLIPWFGKACRDNAEIRPEVLASLGNICKTLWDLTFALQELSKAQKRNPQAYPPDGLVILKKWIQDSNADSMSFQEVLQAANIKIQGYRTEAIEAFTPFLKTHDEAVDALSELRTLGRPAITQFPAILSESTPRCRMRLLRALCDLRPDWRDVAWFVQNDDSEIALAGYCASKQSMALTDIPEALEGIRKLQKTLADQRRQLEARDVINTLEYRLRFKE